MTFSYYYIISAVRKGVQETLEDKAILNKHFASTLAWASARPAPLSTKTGIIDYCINSSLIKCDGNIYVDVNSFLIYPI